MATNNAVNTSLSGQTGTGNFVGATSPTLVTPALGTPSALVLTNATSLPASALPAPNYTLSSSSGNYSTSSGTPAAVTNLSCAITTLGRPVMLVLIPDGTTNPASIYPPTGGTMTLTYYRGITAIAYYQLSYLYNGGPGAILTYDIVTAGSYTYTIQASVNASTGGVAYCKLLAMETY